VAVTTSLRRLVVPPAKVAVRGALGLRTMTWPPASRLFVVHEGAPWSVAEDAAHLEATAARLGVPTGPADWARFTGRQAVFHTSHFEAIREPWLRSTHRLGVAWLHGRPGTETNPEFDHAWSVLRADPHRFDRVQVTHAEMEELVLEAGVEPERIFRIPIGIDLEHFTVPGEDERLAARERLGLPGSAFVVGSFQKDGVGWGEGLEPKLIKGPDVLVAALRRVSARVPELHVLLTGPARGYVRHALDEAGIPHVHVRAGSRAELAAAFHALDAYVVASRQEGGPKGVLEALASGVPLVTTRVGQAPDIVQDGLTGLLVDVEDTEGLSNAIVRVHDDRAFAVALSRSGRPVAERYDNPLLDPLWAGLLAGFVAHGRPS
jgi:glycosyltransferase involved in cell wall biosynthesis